MLVGVVGVAIVVAGSNDQAASLWSWMRSESTTVRMTLVPSVALERGPAGRVGGRHGAGSRCSA